MFWLAAWASITLVVSGLIQIGFVWRFRRFVRQASPPNISPGWCPKAAVVLCVRGYDSCLDECLHGLMSQDYSNYVVHVVVDSELDPAWNPLCDWQQRFGVARLQLSPLRNRRKTCSLKCSSLVQAVHDLDESHEVIVLIDADVCPLPNWLSKLVNPLSDPEVGLSTGNRWFEPQGDWWGTKVRAVWNAGAIVQMFNFEIPWGGSLAMRRDYLVEHRVADYWSKSFNDDVILRDLLLNAGRRLYRVPELLMINREDIPLRDVWGWTTRQCVHFRHYHRNWRQVGYFNILVTIVSVLMFVLLPITLALGQWTAAEALLVGMASYYVGMVTACVWIESSVQRVLRQQKLSVQRLGWSILWVYVLTHLVYGVSSVSAAVRRNVSWRGISYRIHSALDVEMLHDAPFQACGEDSNVSII